MGVPGAWARALLLLLLVAVTTEAQNSVCSREQLIFEVTENDNEILNQPLANFTTDSGIDVVLTTESTEYFEIRGKELFLKEAPDYENQTILLANMECLSGNAVVGKLNLILVVLDVNDNAPEFRNKTYTVNVSEDARVGTVVIPASELQAEDKDQNDVLYYSLEGLTTNATEFFSLLSKTQPGLKLLRRLNYNYEEQRNMTFRLVVHDTENDIQTPRHSAEATVVVEVLPADLRPPWFLPCAYSDANTCIQAQYRTTVPINVPPPNPLEMSPGPIYAVDGDWAINARIVYSLVNEGEDSIFRIDPDTGNLTMRESVDSPRTFRLLVKGTQESDTVYSVTQVTVDVTSNKSHVSFPLSLYRGFVVLGQGANVAVKDSADPSQPLTLRARDITFPEYNSHFQYRIVDNKHFHMDGEAVLTTDQLVDPGVYNAMVEATNNATQSLGSTKVEIRVLSPPTPPPGTDSSGTSQATTTSGTPGTGTASSTGTVTVTETGTVTSTVTTPGTLTTLRTVTAPGTATTSGTSGTVTATPGKVTTSGIETATPGTVTTSGTSGTMTATPGKMTTSGIEIATPGTVTTSGTSGTVTATPGKETTSGIETTTLGTVTTSGTGTGISPWTGTVPGGSEDGGDSGTHPETESLRFSAAHMAALGGVLGALLLVTLLALSVLVHKHYGHRFRCCCCSRNSLKSQPEGYDNKTFTVDSEDNWAPASPPAPSPAHVETAPASPTPSPTATPSPPASPATPVAPGTPEGGSPAAVRSILTKERRPEGGYKAVWFGEDIGAEADVVVLNSPTVDAQAGSDSERDSDHDSDHQGDSGSEYGAPGDSTYI